MHERIKGLWNQYKSMLDAWGFPSTFSGCIPFSFRPSRNDTTNQAMIMEPAVEQAALGDALPCPTCKVHRWHWWVHRWEEYQASESFWEWLNRYELEPFYRAVMAMVVRVTYCPKYEGFEQIPKSGPAILIANHVSYMDGPLISAGCKRPIRYVIYRDIYQLPVVNYFMRHAKAIPIYPKREEVEAALDEVSEALKNGELVCIFPEGQLTYTGHLGRFRPGVEFIFQRDPVPIIPIAISGMWGSVFSRKYRRSRLPFWPRRWGRKPMLICGYPVKFEDVNVNKLQRILLNLIKRARNMRIAG